jgi:hypothetical protein
METTTVAQAAPRVRVRLLGAVGVEAGGAEVDLGGPRVRALLATLALGRGRTLSHASLMTDVWGEATPGIRSSLRASISRLRTTALGPYLGGGRSGYALVPGPDLEVDLWRAVDIAEAETVPAPDDLGWLAEASTVPAFDGTATAPATVSARPGVERIVRRALLRAVDAHLADSRALPAIERLVAREPADPELRALLITVHAAQLGGGPALRADSITGPAVAATQVPAAFPTRRIGVPAPIAVYQRRPDDEARMSAALRLSRLVTLVGPSGGGKSRLAIEWARGSASAGNDHVWFCRPGGTSSWHHDLALLVGAESGSVGSIAERLRPLQGTIVIDGLDQHDIREGSESFPDGLAIILGEAPGVSVMATSRRPLGVPGESVLRIEALSVADARSLFLLRSGPQPGSSSDPSSGSLARDDVIDALVTSLARLPLAIELAAGHAAQAPLTSVLDAVSARGPNGRGVLEAALEATLQLLPTEQRVALAALCIFRGPFAVESAVALLGEVAESHIEALVGWSLLVREGPEGLMLRVPEVVRRQVGGAGLRQHPPHDDAAHDWHMVWYAARTRSAFSELTTFEAGNAWRRLDTERADIDRAFERAIEVSDRGSALSIVAGRAWAAVTSGTQVAVLALARRAADVPGAAPAAVEAQFALGRGFLAYQLGCMSEAGAALGRALSFAQVASNPELIALAHAFRAYFATLSPNGARDALASIGRARAQLGRLPVSTQAMVTLIAAQVERSRGRPGEALRHAASAGVLARRAGHGWVELMSAVVAGKAQLDAKDPAGALTSLRAALSDPRVLADPVSVLIITSVAAGAAAGIGADDAGAHIIGAVDAIGRRFGFDPRANEPADFSVYRRRVQQGMTTESWRDAYARGRNLSLADLVDEAASLGV